ncbi:carbohydrate ABC transporter permease [Bifidobacterium breve]|uniref:carbohydrate ABC transporter permease n=1 Tax=Bifidobacterium breve TaxID=1685 RepID=UPI001F2FB55D|nr:sugar ABC transporter permease [Bifidobacterium breve]
MASSTHLSQSPHGAKTHGERTANVLVAKNRLTGAVMLVPALALLVVFVFGPLVRVVMMSMQGTDIFGSPSGFIGLENYRTVFTDPAFVKVLIQTFLYAVLVVAGRIALGVLLAILLTRHIMGIKILRVSMTSIVSVSVAAASLGFLALFGSSGVINSIIEKLGIRPVGFLTDAKWAFFTVTLVTIWTGLGFALILLCAAIDGVDQEILEAARIDGANEARIQWSIVLPLITPTLFYIAVTTCIEALQAFAQINILTKGGPGQATTTITYNIYTTAFNAGSANFGIASALGIVLFLFVFVLTLLQFRFLEGKVNY